MFISLIEPTAPIGEKEYGNYDHTMTSSVITFDHGSMGLVPPLAYATGQATVLVAVFLSPWATSIPVIGGIFIEFLLNKLLSRWKGNLRAVRDRPKLNFLSEDKLPRKG